MFENRPELPILNYDYVIKGKKYVLKKKRLIILAQIIKIFLFISVKIEYYDCLLKKLRKGRQARPWIKPDTSRQSALSAEPLCHWWGQSCEGHVLTLWKTC